MARQLGLTRSAVTTITQDLLENKYIRETESGPATGGRRAILLEMNPDRGKVAGIDMGATHLNLVVTDFSARVLHEVETPIDVQCGPGECLRIIDLCLRDTLKQTNSCLEEVLAIGVGVPGPVVSDAGMVSAPPIMPGWDNYPIREHLEQYWNRPVSLNNDAELGALGEWAYGAGRCEKNLAYIKVGTGVGAGLLLDGRIYRGATGSAGEIGHMTIQENGPLCTCGNRGCLEAMAGGLAIARQARAAVLAGRRSELSNHQPVDGITAHDVVNAARRGDLVAQQIMTEAGTHLGIAIAGLVNLFNPGIIVVGGGVALMGDLLLDPIRQNVRDRSLRSAATAVRISAAVLGRRSSSMGAVVQALNLVLDRLTEKG
jgi:glucokinase-like ROK family protein